MLTPNSALQLPQTSFRPVVTIYKEITCAPFESMRATHNGLRGFLKNQAHLRQLMLFASFVRNWKRSAQAVRRTLEVFESRMEQTSGRMAASVTMQKKDSQSRRLLELREKVQTNERDWAVNIARGGETSGRPPGNAATSLPRARTFEYPMPTSGSDPGIREQLQHYGCGPAWADWVRPSMEIVAARKCGAAFKA